MYGERGIPGYIKTEDEAIEYTNVHLLWSISLWSDWFYPEGNIYIYPDGSIEFRDDITKRKKILFRITNVEF